MALALLLPTRTLLTGWGRTTEGGGWSRCCRMTGGRILVVLLRQLRKLRIPIVPDSVCDRNVGELWPGIRGTPSIS